MGNNMAKPEQNQNGVHSVYALLILSDIGIAWYRLITHFQSGALLFRPIETVVKLTVMAFVLKGKRWSVIVQLLLSTIALLSCLLLFTQTNRRAVNDPLTWISLGVQILAGLIVLAGARWNNRASTSS